MNKPIVNYVVDALMAVSFVVTAVSGVVMFFFLPDQVRGGGFNQFFGITKSTWKVYHDWSGLLMIILVLIHLILHWNWMVCMTKSFFKKRK